MWLTEPSIHGDEIYHSRGEQRLIFPQYERQSLKGGQMEDASWETAEKSHPEQARTVQVVNKQDTAGI